MIPMATSTKNPSWKFPPSFALISVLALVSLAALTATAFLASARLERQASSSIGKTTLLEMALNSGKFCATQLINDYSQTDLGNTAIVTYWRTNWTDELGYPFIAKTKTSGSGNGQNSAMWYYAPLFSPAGVTNLGTNNIQNAMRFTNIHQGTFSNDMQTFMTTSATNSFIANPGLTNSKCVQIPLLGGRTSPPVGWVYIDQEKRKFGSNLTNTSPAVRIAWFTEDLEGLIDAERMGAATDRSTGTNSEEISLSSATGTSGAALVSSPSTFTNKRASYISYGLLATNSGLANPTNARYFASGLRAWAPTNAASPNNGALAWIPVGIPVSGTSNAPKGYANQGYTKLSIINLINLSGTTTNAVSNIAAAITNNLPSFTNRAGGMAGGTYVSNIAANIVDLFDSDNFATAVGNSVRGIDSYPFVNEIWDRVVLTNIIVTPSTTTNWVVTYRLEITTWMELWNLSSQPVTNGSMSIFYQNREVLMNRTSEPNDIPVSFTNSLNYTSNLSWNFTNTFLPTNPGINSLTNSRISPNAFHMVAFPTFTTNVSITNIPPSTPSTKTNLVLLWAANGNLNGYATYFSSNSASLPSSMSSTHPSRVDSSSSAFNGIQRNTNNPTNHFLASSQTVWWRGNATPNSDLSLGLTGDPRIRFHLSPTAGQTWLDHPFESNRASWWARNTMGAGASNFTVNLNLWPEYSHNSSSYPNTTNASQDPLSITMPAQETNKPVQIIYNTLPTNIVQLGQTFDPMQWSYDASTITNGLPLTGATAASSSGGGHTLRIGRAEHPRFAFTNMYNQTIAIPIPNMGMSAAALLDLFCITNGTSISGGPYSLGGGKININTAPAPVLRALAGGIRLTNDPTLTGVGGSGTNFPIPSAMAEAFAQGVMRFRSKYPFLTPSHLSFIGTDSTWPNTNNWPNNAVFGNTNTITLDSTAPGNTFGGSTKINVNEWNDQSAEEWFSKIYALSSCQSHNFRIYVVAQLVATNSSGQTNPIGPLVKKYYQVFFQNGSAVSSPSGWPATTSTYSGNNVSTWTPTGYSTDILQSYY
jgi:hypothetical protein